MSAEIEFRVSGYPPAKGEALSMLGVGHSHAPRVRTLLEAARAQIAGQDFAGFGRGAIGLELTVSCPDDGNRSDATNYLGGIADVLENKSLRGAIEHLGELGQVTLYENDRQIEEVRYHWQEAVEPSYRIRLWAMGREGAVEEAGAGREPA